MDIMLHILIFISVLTFHISKISTTIWLHRFSCNEINKNRYNAFFSHSTLVHVHMHALKIKTYQTCAAYFCLLWSSVPTATSRSLMYEVCCTALRCSNTEVKHIRHLYPWKARALNLIGYPRKGGVLTAKRV